MSPKQTMSPKFAVSSGEGRPGRVTARPPIPRRRGVQIADAA